MSDVLYVPRKIESFFVSSHNVRILNSVQRRNENGHYHQRSAQRTDRLR